MNEQAKNFTHPEYEQSCNIPSNAYDFNMPYISVKDKTKLLQSMPKTHPLDPLDINGYLRLAQTTLAAVLSIL